MTVSIFSPFLKIMTVGMLRMPYSVATPGLSSVFSLNCATGEDPKSALCQSSCIIYLNKYRRR